MRHDLYSIRRCRHCCYCCCSNTCTRYTLTYKETKTILCVCLCVSLRFLFFCFCFCFMYIERMLCTYQSIPNFIYYLFNLIRIYDILCIWKKNMVYYFIHGTLIYILIENYNESKLNWKNETSVSWKWSEKQIKVNETYTISSFLKNESDSTIVFTLKFFGAIWLYIDTGPRNFSKIIFELSTLDARLPSVLLCVIINLWWEYFLLQIWIE